MNPNLIFLTNRIRNSYCSPDAMGVDSMMDVDAAVSDGDDDVPLYSRRPPPRYTTTSCFYQTRKRGKFLKRVSELYLRDDLGFGCYYVDDRQLSDARKAHVDKVLGRPQTIRTAQHLLSLLQPCQPHSLVICDTNVLLHNLDVIEQAAAVIPNIVIPQTALQECRSNQIVAYNRTVELLRAVGGGGKSESGVQKRCCILFPDPYHVSTVLDDNEAVGMSINDRNDLRIRNVAEYFGEHLQGTGIRVILLTDDAASRNEVVQSKGSNLYEAHSVRSWIQDLERQNPQLMLQDLVAQFHSESMRTVARQKAPLLFAPHLDAAALSRGIQTGLYHRGVFRSRDTDSAVVTIRRGDERVAVTVANPTDRNRAVEGDVVAIALHPLDQWLKSSVATKKLSTGEGVYIASETAEPTLSELSNVQESMMLNDASSWQPTGKVVGIVRRNFENHSGSIYETKVVDLDSSRSERELIAAHYEREHADGSMTCVFFPIDKKVSPILIRTAQRDRLLGQRIIVAMDSWPAGSPFPLGHYVRTIGVAGSKDVETQVLLQQFDIPHDPFPAAVLACLPPEEYRIDAGNSPGREDLRHLPVLSIDPPNCKDIDDALHCIELPNGNFQVGVHIADVTHYVKPGTAMDLEAANRSTSTYLVNKRLDMLPGLLTTDLCSLKGNLDRYAFSVLWEVTPDAEIVKVDFKKTLIHSIAALTYQQAQTFIDHPDDPDDIQACAVKRLAFLARKFRRRRIDAGALTLASPEVKCELVISIVGLLRTKLALDLTRRVLMPLQLFWIASLLIRRMFRRMRYWRPMLWWRNLCCWQM
jgi:exosome complex exonuclease DIS3/RRP44